MAGSPADDNADLQARLEASQSILGVHPVRIMDDIFNSAQDYLCDGADCLEKSLREAVNDSVPEDVIKCIADRFHSAVSARLDKNLDKMELYTLSNIISMPRGVVAEQKFENVDAAELEKTEIELERGRAKLLAKIAAAEEIKSNLMVQLSLADDALTNEPEIVDLLQNQTETLMDTYNKLDKTLSLASAYLSSSAKLASRSKQSSHHFDQAPLLDVSEKQEKLSIREMEAFTDAK